MKKYIVVVVLFVICSCATKETVKKETPILSTPPSPPLQEIPLQTIKEPVVSKNESVKSLYGKLLSDIRTSKSSFNPSQGEEVAIYYRLSQSAKVTVNVYDPDWAIIKTLVSEESVGQGAQTVIWDGKDVDGNVVPNEAYFFTIVAEDKDGVKEIYDPTAFSGGVEHDITTADVNQQYQTINYKMPEMGRVMIRMGVRGGPLLKTLVDWEPRVAGVITEYWNGKDEDNIIDLYNHPKFKMIITYFTLPENSVISFGSKGQSYKEYKGLLSVERALKPDRESSVARVSHHYRLKRVEDYAPEVKMTIENSQGTDEKGNMIIKGKTLVKVDIDERDKELFANQQFEIAFFLDYEFYAEDEAGYVPFNWVWDVSSVEEGEHLFTVNLSSFKDQIGVLSHKVKVVK